MGILMIISGIAIPRLKMAITKAKEARAVVELHNLSVLVQSYAAGNNGQYPNSLADIDSDKLNDPWGHPYQYVNLITSSSSARLDHFHLPINTIFDLYSMGSDEVTAQSTNSPEGQDDIVYAGDGAYVGRALEY